MTITNAHHKKRNDIIKKESSISCSFQKKKKLHLDIEDILQKIREQYNIDRCYNPNYISKLANDYNLTREVIIYYMRNEFSKHSNTTYSIDNIVYDNYNAEDASIIIPERGNQPISNVERNRIIKYLLGRMKEGSQNKYEHGAIKDAAKKFHRSTFTIRKINKHWNRAIMDRTDGRFDNINVGHLKNRVAYCRQMKQLHHHHYTRMSDKERQEINHFLQHFKENNDGNITYDTLHNVANRFNRSLKTIRKMSDNLSLIIVKKEVSVTTAKKRKLMESSDSEEITFDESDDDDSTCNNDCGGITSDSKRDDETPIINSMDKKSRLFDISDSEKDKERRELNYFLQHFKDNNNGEITYFMLNDIANRFNRSLETIRKMSDNLGLTILKKAVSVASMDSSDSEEISFGASDEITPGDLKEDESDYVFNNMDKKSKIFDSSDSEDESEDDDDSLSSSDGDKITSVDEKEDESDTIINNNNMNKMSKIFDISDVEGISFDESEDDDSASSSDSESNNDRQAANELAMKASLPMSFFQKNNHNHSNNNKSISKNKNQKSSPKQKTNASYNDDSMNSSDDDEIDEKEDESGTIIKNKNKKRKIFDTGDVEETSFNESDDNSASSSDSDEISSTDEEDDESNNDQQIENELTMKASLPMSFFLKNNHNNNNTNSMCNDDSISSSDVEEIMSVDEKENGSENDQQIMNTLTMKASLPVSFFQKNNHNHNNNSITAKNINTKNDLKQKINTNYRKVTIKIGHKSTCGVFYAIPKIDAVHVGKRRSHARRLRTLPKKDYFASRKF